MFSNFFSGKRLDHSIVEWRAGRTKWCYSDVYPDYTMLQLILSELARVGKKKLIASNRHYKICAEQFMVDEASLV